MDDISKLDDGTIIIQPQLYHNTKPEYILCAAIWYKNGEQCQRNPTNIEYGYVVCGRRHADVIAIHQLLSGRTTGPSNSVQGFITSKNRFVDRKEANTIAMAANQTLYNKKGEELISEDLY